MTTQNSQGQALKICNHGELLITNNRIIVFTYQDSNPDKIETAWDIALHDCEYVGYEDSILNVKGRTLHNVRIRLRCEREAGVSNGKAVAERNES